MYSRLNALLGVDNQNYGRYRDTVSDNQWQQTFDTNKAQRDLENQRWDTQWGFQQQQYADSRGDANFSKAQTLIGMGFSTQEIADALGITPEQANNYAAMAQQIMKKQGTITGNGGGDGGGKPKLTAAQVNAAIKAGNTTPDVLAAYEYYYGEPYSGDTQEAPKLTAAQVSAAIKNGQTSEEVLSAYEYYYGEPYVPDFKSYDSAVNYAKRIGLDVQGMLTESRWNQGKHYNVDDPAMSYDTYGDYVHDYLVYAMSK
jgi:hypothetical protein